MNNVLKGSVQLKSRCCRSRRTKKSRGPPPAPPLAPLQPPPDTLQPTDPELHIHPFLMSDGDEEEAQGDVGMIQAQHHPPRSAMWGGQEGVNS